MGVKAVKIDKLGRIVIPKTLRNELSISFDTPLQIRREGGSVLITPVGCTCALCGSLLNNANEIRLCGDCIAMVKEKY